MLVSSLFLGINVNVNGHDSHMVYELDELLFRVNMCSNIFVRTHLFCFIKAQNRFGK